jgi:hypothetical protein
MSLFQLGMSSLEVREEKMEFAELELRSVSLLYDTMTKACKSKCIPGHYGEEDLNKGETVCVDRCVAKFFKTNLMVGEFIQNSGIQPSTYDASQLRSAPS